MNADQAISRMIPPSKGRSGIWRNGVLQIWVTRSCDKACFHCTQGSNLKGPFQRMSPELFEEACISLKGYWGVVGMFGGNPTLHPQFAELCEIMRRHVPFEQRGIWTNKLFGKGSICRETFNPEYSNLNVHMDQEAWDEFKRDWPEGRVKGIEDSRHSSPFIAMKDLDRLPTRDGGSMENTEENRWELIHDCDINKYWSALIGVFRGELRAWFCEIAASQAMMQQHIVDYPDTGLRVTQDWWRKPMSDYADQAKKHCHECSIPLRAYGELAINGNVEQISETYKDVYVPKVSGRPVQIVKTLEELRGQSLKKATDYIENGKI